MGLDQYFYTVKKELVCDIRHAYNEGHNCVVELALDNLFNGYKNNEFYQRKNWALDTVILDRCKRLVENDDSVYVVKKETIKSLLKVKRFSDMSKEDSDRVVFAIKTLASIYNEYDDNETTMLYLRSY